MYLRGGMSEESESPDEDLRQRVAGWMRLGWVGDACGGPLGRCERDVGEVR